MVKIIILEARAMSFLNLGFLGRNFLYLILFSFFIGPLVFGVNLNHHVYDAFHEGEYLGAVFHITEYYKGAIEFPIFIHGAMDYIPSVIALNIFGYDKIIIGTRLINTTLVFIAWVLFLDIFRRLSIKSWGSYLFIFFPIVILFLASKNYNDTLNIHHAIIGPRDFFLLVSLWFLVIFCSSNSIVFRRIISAFVLVSSTTALYWSYDRGIMASLVIFSVLFLNFNNDKRSLIFNLVLLVLFVLILEYTKIFGSVKDYLNNILYWIKNSSAVWGDKEVFPITPNALLLPVTLLSLIPLTYLAYKKDRSNGSINTLVIVIVLFIIELLLIKTIFNRPGMPRLSWGLWPLILIVTYGVSRVASRKTIIEENSLVSKSFDFRFVVFALPIYLIVITFSSYFFNYPRVNGVGYFYKTVKNPPTDISLINNDLVKSSMILGKEVSSCAFLWSNEGVISLIAKVPVCSKFFYPVYAAPEYDKSIIESLKISTPEVIITESPNWSINIDGKHMRERLPEVWEYIIDNYIYQVEIGDYHLRSYKPDFANAFSGNILEFDNHSLGQIYLNDGWSNPEDWGVWSDDRHANIKLVIPRINIETWSSVKISAKGFVDPDKTANQTVDVLINGAKQGDMVFVNNMFSSFIIEIPKKSIDYGQSDTVALDIKFIVSNPVSPSSLNLSSDSRRLGIGLAKIEFY